MARTATNRLDSLIALSRDGGATLAERALAASHAARLLEQAGRSYLEVYPHGLPETDDWRDDVDWTEWDDVDTAGAN